jgi:hypothetical protein
MIYDEEREEYNRDEPSDSKDKWEEIGLKLEDEWEGVDIEKYSKKAPPHKVIACVLLKPTH